MDARRYPAHCVDAACAHTLEHGTFVSGIYIAKREKRITEIHANAEHP